MISIQRFNYAGYSSEDFDLCCQLSFDDNSGEVSTFLSREAVASETYRGEIQRVSSYKYTDVLAPTITLVDKDFGEFDLDRQRKILRWLTSKYTPSFITIYHDDSNVVSYEILGAFTELNTYKNGSGRVIGFTCVYTSISPFAYSALQTITRTITDTTNNTFNIEVDSDNEESAIYPRITIQKSGSGDVVITNTYADQNQQSRVVTLQLKNNVNGETIVVDGANRVISSSHTNRIFGDDFVNWSWLPLYNETNNITVAGNCTVTFEYREPRKVGEF